MLDTLIGVVALLIAAVVARYAWILYKLYRSDTSTIESVSGPISRVFNGQVPPRVDGRNNPMVSAGIVYDVKGKKEKPQGFVSDEVITGAVRRS